MGLLNRRLAELLRPYGQQAYLARALGESRQRINNWVRGLSEIPSDDVPRIAMALGMTMEELYGAVPSRIDTSTLDLATRLVRVLGISGDRVEINVIVREGLPERQAIADVVARRLEELAANLPESDNLIVDAVSEWLEHERMRREAEEGLRATHI